MMMGKRFPVYLQIAASSMTLGRFPVARGCNPGDPRMSKQPTSRIAWKKNKTRMSFFC